MNGVPSLDDILGYQPAPIAAVEETSPSKIPSLDEVIQSGTPQFAKNIDNVKIEDAPLDGLRF